MAVYGLFGLIVGMAVGILIGAMIERMSPQKYDDEEDN